MASLTPSEMQYQLSHASEDRSGNVIAAVVACLCLAFIAVGMRLFGRRMTKTSLGADDWMILVALFFNVIYATSTLILVRFGLGRHAITLEHPVSTAKSEISTEVLYNPAMITVKFSILLLYNRIFPSPKFKIVLWAVAAFVFCYTVAGISVVIFQCVPVRSDWDPSIKPRCVNLDAELIAIGVLNSITDFLILGLPVPFLWRLHSSLSHKIQLLGMFSLGGFVCITSIVRVIAVSSISLTDGSWVNTYPAIWAFVETSIAVVSACLPTLRPVYKYVIYGKKGLSQPTKPGLTSGNSNGVDLTKSNSPWQKGLAAKEGRFGRLGSSGVRESTERLPEAV
ncbi:hypothetical protein MMC28_008190 [Mycoblastus sanguinarius]|nr:hypothetical protein [Mycoblastus sanguinarius]